MRISAQSLSESELSPYTQRKTYEVVLYPRRNHFCSYFGGTLVLVGEVEARVSDGIFERAPAENCGHSKFAITVKRLGRSYHWMQRSVPGGLGLLLNGNNQFDERLDDLIM
jgi:hypothetical protein